MTKAAAGTGELVGCSISHFEVIDRIGHGGMGVVYLAEDTSLGRRVALKVLPPAVVEDPTWRERFVREARNLAAVSNANVATVYEVGEHEALVYIAMEYVEGRTLREEVAEGPLSTDRVIEIAAQIVRGLAAVHGAEIVHRDLKPENVMVTADGEVKLLDFGIAKLLSGPWLEHTEAGKLPSASGNDDHVALAETIAATCESGVVGTPDYMSPEQARGLDVDHRSDYFSLGCLLYELVSGSRPFERPELVDQIVARLWEDPRPIGRRLPARLARVISTCLAKDAKGRYDSAEEILAVLDPPPPRWTRYAAGAAVLVTAVVVGVLIAQSRGGDKATDGCANGADRFAGVWDDSVRDSVRATFLATDRSHAKDTIDKLSRVLDGYRDEWIDTYTQTCTEIKTAGDDTPPELHLRMACLAQRRVSLAALTEVFTNADAELVDAASAAVGQLEPINQCGDPRYLATAAPLPTDPTVRLAVDALQARVARVEALFRAGRYKTGLEEVKPLVKEARTVDYAPVLARAIYFQGTLEMYSNDAVAAEVSFDEAGRIAADQGLDDLLALILLRQVWAIGVLQRRDQEGIALGRAAEMAAIRAGSDPAVLAELFAVVGGAYVEADDFEAAKKIYERGLALRKQLGDHLAIAALLHNLGNLYAEMGEYDRAREHLDESRDLFEKLLGPEHPALTTTSMNLGIIEALGGRYDDAATFCERADKLRSIAYADEDPMTAWVGTCLGMVHVGKGRPLQAIPLLENAVEVFTATNELEVGLPIAQFDLARALWDAGRDTDRAIALVLSALDTWRANESHRRVHIEAAQQWLGQRAPNRLRENKPPPGH